MELFKTPKPPVLAVQKVLHRASKTGIFPNSSRTNSARVRPM